MQLYDLDMRPIKVAPQRKVDTFNASYITKTVPLNTINLNWTENELPERLRTKHVHRLHPYLGKFVPQLVEIFLRKFSPKTVCDPFCGSGTTLVEANALGIASVGSDISEFNCLINKVKTDEYDLNLLEKEVKDILGRLKNKEITRPDFRDVSDTDNEYLKSWFAERVRKHLLFFRSQIPDYTYQDFFKVVLSRAARSARLTTHFDLDFPRTPQKEPYYCYKHKRVCKPTDDALKFLNRYTLDALRRVQAFSKIRSGASVKILQGDSRHINFPKFDFVFTSPPYVGLIDYHEQHRYAYELLGLKWNAEQEIGPMRMGSSKKAQMDYIQNIGEVFSNVRSSLSDGGLVAIVVNDKNQLYDDLPQKIGFELEEKVTREEVAHYIKYETGSMSGLRQLGRIQGDWRPIDAIAEDCAWVFNEIDKELGK